MATAFTSSAGTLSGDREALLERAGELAAIRTQVAATAAGAGGVVIVEGPAGIGKTSLLAAGRDAAVTAGIRTLIARSDELEREFAFGVARQLLEPVVHPASGAADPGCSRDPRA